MKSLRVISLFLLYLAPILGILLFGGILFLGYDYYDKLNFLKTPFVVLEQELLTLGTLTNLSLTTLDYGLILLFANVIAGILYLPLMSFKNNKGIKLWGIINTFLITIIITVLSVLLLYCIFGTDTGILSKFMLNYPLIWSPFLYLLPAILMWLGFILALIHFIAMLHYKTEKKEIPTKIDKKLEDNNKQPKLKVVSIEIAGSDTASDVNSVLQEKVQKLRQKLGKNIDNSGQKNNSSTNKNFANASNNNNQQSNKNDSIISQYEKYGNKNINNDMYYRTINKQSKNIVHQSESGQKLAETADFIQQNDKIKKINNKFFINQQDNNKNNINDNFIKNNKRSIQDGDKIWNATKLYRQDMLRKKKENENID